MYKQLAALFARYTAAHLKGRGRPQALYAFDDQISGALDIISIADGHIRLAGWSNADEIVLHMNGIKASIRPNLLRDDVAKTYGLDTHLGFDSTIPLGPLNLIEVGRFGLELHGVAPSQPPMALTLVIAGKANQVFDMRIRAAEILAKRLSPQMGIRNRPNLQQLRDLTNLLEIYAYDHGDHSGYLNYLLRDYEDQAVICDITPAYAILDRKGFAQMAQIGSAKFIFILRDPIDRMWSQIRMAIKTTSPPPISFQDACVARAGHLIKSGRLPNIERADYRRTISELEAAVPQCRIRYLFYEDMFKPTTMNALCDFLGIQPIAIDPDNHSNLGAMAAMPAGIHAGFCEAFREQYAFVHRRFGELVPSQWDTGFKSNVDLPGSA